MTYIFAISRAFTQQPKPHHIFRFIWSSNILSYSSRSLGNRFSNPHTIQSSWHQNPGVRGARRLEGRLLSSPERDPLKAMAPHPHRCPPPPLPEDAACVPDAAGAPVAAVHRPQEAPRRPCLPHRPRSAPCGGWGGGGLGQQGGGSWWRRGWFTSGVGANIFAALSSLFPSLVADKMLGGGGNYDDFIKHSNFDIHTKISIPKLHQLHQQFFCVSMKFKLLRLLHLLS